MSAAQVHKLWLLISIFLCSVFGSGTHLLSLLILRFFLSLFLFLFGRRSSKKANGCAVSDRIGMKFGGNWSSSKYASIDGIGRFQVGGRDVISRKSLKGSVSSNRITLTLGLIFLQLNTHRLTKSDFLIWRHAFKMAAMASFYVRPPLAAAASAGCPSARRARVTSVPIYWFCKHLPIHNTGRLAM